MLGGKGTHGLYVFRASSCITKYFRWSVYVGSEVAKMKPLIDCLGFAIS